MTCTMDEARKIWEPHHYRIVKVVEDAWTEHKRLNECRREEGFPPQLYSRTKSNDIFDAIARYAFVEFADDDAFMLKIEAQTFKLFHKGCCIRFKKSGENLLGQNIPTQAVMDFVEPNGYLPGFPPVTAKLEIVWVANDLFTDLESIHMVARDGDRLIWEYLIDRNGGADIFEIPKNPLLDPSEDATGLVSAKWNNKKSSVRE